MSYFLNFWFSNISILFIYFSCCFSQTVDFDHKTDKVDDSGDYQSIVFRVINGKPARKGEVKYQVSRFQYCTSGWC